MLGLIEFAPIVKIGLGPLRISPHGIATGVGFVAGARLLLPATRSRGIDDELIIRMLYRAAIGALVGARLAYALNHLSEYSNDPLSALAIWEGGISLFGGIAGGVIAALPVMRTNRLGFWRLMDLAAPGLALGILIGRVGDLIVADHLGEPTNFALGFRCSAADTASRCAAPIGQGVHMPALYDLLSVSMLLAILLLVRRRHHWTGFSIIVFAAWYGAGRFVEDFFRIDDVVVVGLSGSQLTALFLTTTATAWLILGRRTPPFDPAPEAGLGDEAENRIS